MFRGIYPILKVCFGVALLGRVHSDDGDTRNGRLDLTAVRRC